MSEKYKVIKEHVTGHRRLAGTDWPIVDQLVRDCVARTRPVWLIVSALCNGTPDGSTEYKTKRQALAAWRYTTPGLAVVAKLTKS